MQKITLLVHSYNGEIAEPVIYDSAKDAYEAMYEQALKIAQNGDEFIVSGDRACIERAHKDLWQWRIFTLAYDNKR